MQAVFEYLNTERTRSGLGVLRQSVALDTAAADHAGYLTVNPDVGATHVQDAARPGFTARTAAERVFQRGYFGSLVETVALSDTTALDGARDLMSAPYHRIGLLGAGLSNFGASFGGRTPLPAGYVPLVVLGGQQGVSQQPMRPEAAGVSLHPVASAQSVPLLMFPEEPNPVPELGAWGQNGRYPGYPVSVHVPHNVVLTATSFTLNAVGANGALVSVPVKLLDRTDSIYLSPSFTRNWAFVVPLVPLQPDTTYEASFTGTADSTPLVRTWRFTTRHNTAVAAGASRLGRAVVARFDMPSRAIGSSSYMLTGCPAAYTVRVSSTARTVTVVETGAAAPTECSIRVNVNDAVTGASVSQDIRPASL